MSIPRGDMEFGLTDREKSVHREAPNRHIRGSKKYLEMIDRGSKEADKKNLPFTFSAPKKPEMLGVFCCCPKCMEVSNVSKKTYMLICFRCGTLYKVEDNKFSW